MRKNCLDDDGDSLLTVVSPKRFLSFWIMGLQFLAGQKLKKN